MNNNLDKKLLEALLMASGPSACEKRAAEVFRHYIGSKAEQLLTDNMGNTVALINSEGAYKVMIAAHIDEIGFQVSGFCNDGLLRIRKVGGVNTANLNGHTVLVLTDHAQIEGVLVCQTNGNNVVPDIDSFYIDINASSREEAEQMVALGDYVTFTPVCSVADNVITSKSLDNRIGVYVILQVIDQLAGQLKNVQLLVAATTQEEIGLRGMALVAQQTMPDMCVVFDVTDAQQIGKEGLPQINKGCVVYQNADSNPVLKKMIMDVAQENHIPYQTAVGRNVTGGTDSSRIQIFSPSTAVAEIAIPCKYIHSHSEKCGVQDVENCIQLTVSLLKSLDKDLSDGREIKFCY